MSFIKINTAKAMGPIWTGQIVTILTIDTDGESYSIQWLPDKNNQLLRDNGLAMHYYYLPNAPRLATRNDNTFKFHLQKFSGILNSNKNIGEDGYSELAGGTLSFSTTLGPPNNVLQKSFEKLKTLLSSPEMQAKPLFFPKSNTVSPVMAGPIALHSNKTNLHSLNYDPQSEISTNTNGNPNQWVFKIQGAGNSALNVHGEDAFTVMMGRRPTAMLFGSAKTGTSQIVIENHISYYVWTMVTEIKITASYESIFKHLKEGASLGWWYSTIGYEKVVESLVQDSNITVEINFGEGMVDGAKQEHYEKSADAIADAFREDIQKRLSAAAKASTVAEPEKKNAVAENVKAFHFNFGGDFKNIKKEFTGTMQYTKKINRQILKTSELSSNIEGLFNKTSTDTNEFKRYFSEIFFEDSFQKIHVVAGVNAFWGDKDMEGDPIDTISLEVGYPDGNGITRWEADARHKENLSDSEVSDNTSSCIWDKTNKDFLYIFDISKRNGEEEIQTRTTINYKKRPEVIPDKIVIGKITKEHIISISPEVKGKLEVGPISIDMPIESDNTQVVVNGYIKTNIFKREKFTFNNLNINTPTQYFKKWYNDDETVESYDVKTEVIIKGKRFGQKSLRWESNWVTKVGNGPLMLEVPEVPTDLIDKVEDYLYSV